MIQDGHDFPVVGVSTLGEWVFGGAVGYTPYIDPKDARRRKYLPDSRHAKMYKEIKSWFTLGAGGRMVCWLVCCARARVHVPI